MMGVTGFESAVVAGFEAAATDGVVMGCVTGVAAAGKVECAVS